MINIDVPISRFAIAFSGGGDSTALLHMVRHRNPLVLIVDHALRDGSGAEAQKALAFAESLGLEGRVLTWGHRNPQTGVQEKARKARYGLMGQECRERGITHLLTGHTRDDQAETLVMRYDRGTDWRGAAGMSQQVYAPLWPELAAVQVCRPLLGYSRTALRDYNREHGLEWSEDPSNNNTDFARIRAREYLAGQPEISAELLGAAQEIKHGLRAEQDMLMAELKAVKFGRFGDVYLRELPSIALMTLLLPCVGGSAELPSRHRVARIKQNLVLGTTPALTLAGALITTTKDGYLVTRDPSSVKGRSDGNLKPRARATKVGKMPRFWDGRFVMSSHTPGFTIVPYYNLHCKTSPTLEYALKETHPKARPSVPVIIWDNIAYDISDIPGVQCNSLVQSRIMGALNRY